jgi:hypothetical protein
VGRAIPGLVPRILVDSDVELLEPTIGSSRPRWLAGRRAQVLVIPGDNP